jgi:hypothetical protein
MTWTIIPDSNKAPLKVYESIKTSVKLCAAFNYALYNYPDPEEKFLQGEVLFALALFTNIVIGKDEMSQKNLLNYIEILKKLKEK